MPESPRFLLVQGNTEAAEQVGQRQLGGQSGYLALTEGLWHGGICMLVTAVSIR